MAAKPVSDQPSHVAKKLAIFTLCRKGGVGKTTFDRGYIDCARAAGLRVAAFDADGGHGQLLQYYGSRGSDGKLERPQDPFKGVRPFDVRNSKQRDMLVNASTLDADVVLFDLPGGSVDELSEVVGNDTLVFETYREAGFEVVVVIVIDQILGSVKTVAPTVEMFGDSAKYIVVMNTAKAEPDEFIVYNGFEDAEGNFRHGNGRKAIEKAGGQVIAMPGLQGDTYAKLDLDSIQFSAAAANKSLFPADRLRVVAWLKKFRDSLAGSFIDPVAQAAAVAASGETA